MAETCTSIKSVRDFQIKPTETSDLLRTAKDTSELKHTTVFNDVQSVSHNFIHKKQVDKFRHGLFNYHKQNTNHISKA